jgi:hypothetical protein
MRCVDIGAIMPVPAASLTMSRLIDMSNLLSYRHPEKRARACVRRRHVQ